MREIGFCSGARSSSSSYESGRIADPAAVRCGEWFGAEADMSDSQPRLVRIEAGGERGATYPLPIGRTVIGRTEGDLAFADDPLLSGTHASIEVESTTGEDGSRVVRCVLRDEGSRNGVYLRLREPRQLSDGDLIAVGRQVVRFRVRPPAAPMQRVR